MGLIRIIIILIVIVFVSGLVRSFLINRGISRWLPRKKTHNDFISEELYKLNELKKRGVLTEEEFQREKRKLLNR